MTVSIPVLKLVCNDCGEQFDVNPGHFAQMGFKNLPKRCPTCNDVRQKRPSIVQERRVLNVYDGVKIMSLPPAPWRETEDWKKDIPAFRLTWKGSEYGASWSGRIDLFAPTLPQIGDVVSIREMESQHLVKVRQEQKQTMEHGEVIVEKELPITADDPEAEEVIRTRHYLVLEPFDGETTCQLVWAEAHTKTTLKGFGRQYWARVEGAPIASWEVSGGVRSGRAHTTGVLAIVDQEHALYIIKTGDIEGEEIYGGTNE